MSKHSKTPWTFEENDDLQLMVYDADGNPVAQIISEECEADAKFIVKSANEPDCNKQKYIEELAKLLVQRDDLYKELGKINDVAVNLQRSRTTLLEENKCLRDWVRRLADKLQEIADVALAKAETNVFCTLDTSLVREAREAIKEDEP